MDELQNPHDHFVRAVFSRLEIARSFLENYLPAEVAGELDFDTLGQTQESFVDEELRSHHTDLLYNLRLKDGEKAFVYVLLEHKSAADKWTALQLLRYVVRIWEKEKREGAEKLPPIIPLVLYHGQATWKYKTEFSSLVADGENQNLQKLFPNFEYILCDLSEFDEEYLKGIALLQAILISLKYVFADDLPQQFGRMLDLLKASEGKGVIEVLGLILRYLSAASDKINSSDVRKEIKRVFPKKEGEIMKTMASDWVAEGIQQGIEQGIQQGIQQGILLGKRDLAERLIKRRFGSVTQKTRTRLEKLSILQLEDLSVALLDFERVDDLRDWLANARSESGNQTKSN